MENDEKIAYATLAILFMSGRKSGRGTGWEMASRILESGRDETHCGDCTNMPITCSRCVHDEAMELGGEFHQFLADGGWKLARA